MKGVMSGRMMHGNMQGMRNGYGMMRGRVLNMMGMHRGYGARGYGRAMHRPMPMREMIPRQNKLELQFWKYTPGFMQGYGLMNYGGVTMRPGMGMRMYYRQEALRNLHRVIRKLNRESTPKTNELYKKLLEYQKK
jgi:hypothetical protein